MKNHLHHNIHIIRKAIIDKYQKTNPYKIIQIRKVTLNIKLNKQNEEKKSILKKIALLQIITNKTPMMIKSKKNLMNLKRKKKDYTSIYIQTTTNEIYNILDKLYNNIKNIKNETISIKDFTQLSNYEEITHIFNNEIETQLNITITENSNLEKKTFISLIN